MGESFPQEQLPTTSERLVRQILSVKRNHRTRAALRIVDFLDVDLEIDCADDAVTELLVDQRLQRRTVNLQHFVESVDRRIGRYAIRNAAAHWDGLQQTDCVVAEFEFVGYDLGDVGG